MCMPIEAYIVESIPAPMDAVFETMILFALLPAAAEGGVELDEGEGFVLLRGDESELRVEEVGVVGEDFEVAGGSALIADAGEARGVLRGGDELLLLDAGVAGLLGGDERVGDVAEGAEDGLLIVEDQLLFLRLGELKLAAESAACEEGLGDGAGAENDAEEIGEVCTSGSSLAR